MRKSKFLKRSLILNYINEERSPLLCGGYQYDSKIKYPTKIMMVRKITALILIVILCLGVLTACDDTTDKPVVIDFVNHTEKDLENYIGKEVVLYGYFTLNATVDNKAYISSLPYTAVINDQSDYSETTYMPLVIEETGILPVFFNETPEYITTPIKINGILKKVNTYDDVAYVSYNYAITEATYNQIEAYSLGAGFKEFVTFAKKGYPDVVYQNLLNLELFGYGYNKEFPKEENYQEVVTDFKDKKLSKMEESYLSFLEETHLLYETYGEKYSNKEEIDKKVLLEETSEIVENYIDTICKFAAFTVIQDNGNGFDKLEPMFALVEEENIPKGATEVSTK